VRVVEPVAVDGLAGTSLEPFKVAVKTVVSFLDIVLVADIVVSLLATVVSLAAVSLLDLLPPLQENKEVITRPAVNNLIVLNMINFCRKLQNLRRMIKFFFMKPAIFNKIFHQFA